MPDGVDHTEIDVQLPLSNRAASPATCSPHARSAHQVLQSLASDENHGLRTEQVAAHRAVHGENRLAEWAPEQIWRRFFAQFNELVVWILIAAATLSALASDWLDAVVILAIVVLNGLLGFFQEHRAHQALAALRRMSAPKARVVRDGESKTIPAADLVPGDQIKLEAGDHVPADARLVRTVQCATQESALTGESTPVEKDADAVLDVATDLAARRNMVYMGTVVVTGRADAVVVTTGVNTELGKIAGMLRHHVYEPTPLQRRLAQLGRTLIAVCLSVVVVVIALQLRRGERVVDVILSATSLAVAVVPEGLPAVVTLTLAMGLRRMVARNALIRRLPSVETLGAVTVICTDKTGTLTKNEMTVREVFAVGRYEVTGSGYAPVGDIRKRAAAADEFVLSRVLHIGAYCNHAHLYCDARDGGADSRISGDPTEAALLVAACKAGIEAHDRRRRVVHEIPFDSQRKMMSVLVADEGMTCTKGAVEAVLQVCTRELGTNQELVALDTRRHDQILAVAHEMASRALRVIAMAYREEKAASTCTEADMTFAGLVGMIDPPREEAKHAVQKCFEAGIKPVMITGDYVATALAIARELNIARDEDQAMTGAQLDELSDAALVDRVERTAVYARVSPSHKLRIIHAWKTKGHIVAMTGDGVNDAPAIEAADIGISMGLSGTDVAKEASDMVLTDDNFSSIVSAVEEGRAIYDNIQKFIFYLLSSNLSEILFVLVAALVGWPLPLLAIQLLWLNLISDGLPALALGTERPEPNTMRRPPREPRESIITGRRGIQIMLCGGLIAVVTISAFALAYHGGSRDVHRARVVAFCTLALAQLFFAFGCRSQDYTMPQLGMFSNHKLLWAIAISCLLQFAIVMFAPLQSLFKTTGGLKWEWLFIAPLSLVPVTIIEVAKLLCRCGTWHAVQGCRQR